MALHRTASRWRSRGYALGVRAASRLTPEGAHVGRCVRNRSHRPARRTAPASGVLDRDPDPLVDAALRLVANHADAPDLAGMGDVRAAIGLQVEPHDLDRAHLRDPL